MAGLKTSMDSNASAFTRLIEFDHIPEEARRAAVLCDDIPDAPFEARVRTALAGSYSRPPSHDQTAKSLGTGHVRDGP